MLVGIAYNLAIVRSAMNSLDEGQSGGIIISSLPTVSPRSTSRHSRRFTSIQWNSTPTSLLTRGRSITRTPPHELRVVVTQRVERFENKDTSSVSSTKENGEKGETKGSSVFEA